MEQPDTRIIQRSFHDLAIHMARLPNVPALAQGTALLDAVNSFERRMEQLLNRMSEQFDARMNAMEARLDAIEARLDGIDARLDTMDRRAVANNWNNLARLANARVPHPNGSLESLRNTLSNTPIDGFPATPHAISTMGSPELNRILQALEADTGGNIAAKRYRVRKLAGLPELPI